MSSLKAIFWDIDGTLAETDRDGHRVAFNQAFESLGLPWRWDEAYFGELLNITGGRERLRADMAQRADAPATATERDALVEELHRRKTARYAALVRETALPLRPGVRELIDEAHAAGIRQAITSTTGRANAAALLELHFGAAWHERFPVSICAEDVVRKKPDPEVFLRALQALDLSPLEAIAIEDSPGGVAAARAAELPVIVPRSAYFAHATLEGAAAIGPGLHTRTGWRPALAGADGRVTLDDLMAWHSERDSVSQFG